MTELAVGQAGVDAEAAEVPVERAENAHVCANCRTRLQGTFCHACGQRGHLHGRLWHMVEEFAEGIAHFDGRLWRTLPLLVFNPGRLSREWRDGLRVRYVAPLHVFLFGVFLLFLIPTVTGRHLVDLGGMSGEASTADLQVQLGDATPSPERAALADRLEQRIVKKLKDPDFLAYKMESLAYKLSFVLVPISVLILAVLLLFKRGYTFYDHAVVSLYGLGFLALLTVALTPFSRWLPDWTTALLFGGVALHAVAHLRGAYRLSWTGAALRSFPLFFFSVVGFAVFVVGVAALGILS